MFEGFSAIYVVYAAAALTGIMDEGAEMARAFLIHAMRRGIGEHQRREILGMLVGFGLHIVHDRVGGQREDGGAERNASPPSSLCPPTLS